MQNYLKVPAVEQADMKGSLFASKRNRSYHRMLKRRKARLERRRLKLNPDAIPGYGRYRGWES